MLEVREAVEDSASLSMLLLSSLSKASLQCVAGRMPVSAVVCSAISICGTEGVGDLTGGIV